MEAAARPAESSVNTAATAADQKLSNLELSNCSYLLKKCQDQQKSNRAASIK